MNRELKAVLEVYTRKIRTFIDTQISRINTNLRVAYEYLVSRTSKYPVNYDIADRTIWDSEHLLTALTAFSDRKISEPNAIDGISLAQQLTSDAAAALTEIKDTNHGWTMKRAIPSYFSGLKKITLGCKRWEESADRLNPMISGLTSLEEVELEDLEYIPDDNIGNRTSCSLLSGLTACHTVWADKLKRARIVYPTGGGAAVMFYNMPALKKVYMRGLDYFDVYRTDGFNVYLANQDSIEELYLGPMNDYTANKVNLGNQTKLLKIDFPNGLNNSMNLGTWNPTDKGETFLSNFRTYIAERLTDNGSGKTLTLSQAVRDAIHAAEATYGIEAIIVTQKGWTLSPAPGASSQ